MVFSRQEHWSGCHPLPPGDFSDPGMKPQFLISPAVAGRFFTTSATRETCHHGYAWFWLSPFTVDALLEAAMAARSTVPAAEAASLSLLAFSSVTG